jgi:hypothetical protein
MFIPYHIVGEWLSNDYIPEALSSLSETTVYVQQSAGLNLILNFLSLLYISPPLSVNFSLTGKGVLNC